MGLVNQLKPGGRNLVAMGKSEKLLLNAWNEQNTVFFLGWRLRESYDDRSGKKHVGKPIIIHLNLQ